MGRTKVKARKSFLCIESSLRVRNKEHLVNFVVTVFPVLSHHLLTKDLLISKSLIIRSLVKLSRLVESVTRMVTGYLRVTKIELSQGHC